MLVLNCLLCAQLLALQGRPAPKPEVPRALGAEEGWASDVGFPDETTIVIADSDGLAQVSRDGGKS